MNDFFSPSVDDRRQNHRLAIHHHARLRITLDGAEPDRETISGVTLTDISHEGLMAADAGQLVPGARVVLEVPMIGWREADVIWISANRAGCRFVVPLNLEELRLAAVSSHRLAQECPAFATQIAEIAAESMPATAREKQQEAGRAWRWLAPALALSVLAFVSFAFASWLLG